MAKKCEPDPEPAVEETGMADMMMDMMGTALVRSGVLCSCCPRHPCQLPCGLRTMPCPEHRQELLLPQL